MIFSPDQQNERLKWCFDSTKNGAWGDEPDGDHDVVCLRAADFDGVTGRLNDGSRTIRAVDLTTFAKVSLQPGDLIIEKSGGGEKQLVGRAVLFNGAEPSVCSNFLARARPSAKANSAYLNYLLLAIYNARGTWPHIKQSTGIQNLDMASYLNTRVSIPSLEIQSRIAQFLEGKTAQIDALIEKKRALLDRLAEKRQALITHAVTKGLDPNAPMEDSGIDWLGEIPIHWERGNIRRFATMKTGHTPSRSNEDYWETCNIPWFTLADVWQLRDGTRTYLGETKEMISAMGVANSAAELLPVGTVVFSRTASIGYSGIMPVPMATSQDFWNWVCGHKLKPKYLLYLFRSMKQEFAKLTSGSTHKTIYQPVAAGLGICVPPLVEQEAVVQMLEENLGAIDSTIESINSSVAHLVEYRSALIAATVTGKLEI